MNEILVMNQFQAEEYSKGKHDKTSAIISIISHGDDEAEITCNETNNIKAILRLVFNDTDKEDGISEDDAEAIVNFLKTEFINDRIIVHCGAGQSRSAGVAAAIMKHEFNDDSDIFNNKRYTPNMRCYRSVLEKMYELDTDEEIGSNKEIDEAHTKLEEAYSELKKELPDGLDIAIKLYTVTLIQMLKVSMNKTDQEKVLEILDRNLNTLVSARNDVYRLVRPDLDIPELSSITKK